MREPLPAPPALDLPPFPSLDVADISVAFTFDRSGFPEVWTLREVAPAADVALRLRYAELRLQKGFDELLSLGAIHDVEHFGYQLDTVRRVLRDFRGRVLLADEVGLGKTIEACLALKESSATSLVLKNGQPTTSAIASANGPAAKTVYRSRHIKQSSVILIL
jgi:hypothetical protein